LKKSSSHRFNLWTVAFKCENLQNKNFFLFSSLSDTDYYICLTVIYPAYFYVAVCPEFSWDKFNFQMKPEGT